MLSSGNSSNRLRPFKPTPFGRFTLLQPLATGGMGEIFLARQDGTKGFEKLCVIKKILPQYAEEASFVERFINEARILVKLSHGSIAQVLDTGVHDGSPYLALEFVDGKDLRKVAARMRDKGVPLPITFILHVMTRVLDALAYAHRKRDENDQELGLVHRDVSPQNVLVSYEGEVKVIDFGLAKSTLNSTKTNPSIILGKFLYMSPEQARHQKVDRRSDLYAVGLCLYELLSGTNPFDLVAPGELIHAVGSPKIRPLGEVDPLVPPALAALVMKALSPDPAARFQSAEELRGKLTAMLLDIDPGAGPESASRFMREAFASEYQQERRLLATLREVSLAPAPEVTAPRGAELTPTPGPRPSVKPPWKGAVAPAPLSFQPTPRSHLGGESPHESATVPGVVIDVEAMSVRVTRPAASPPSEPPTTVDAVAWPEPVTAQGPVVAAPLDREPATNPGPLPMAQVRPVGAAAPTPWDAAEKTSPATLPFDARKTLVDGSVDPRTLATLREAAHPTREQPIPVVTSLPPLPRPPSQRLPSVMVDPTVATDPGKAPAPRPSLGPRRPAAPARPPRGSPQITEVLPRALKDREAPDLNAEVSRTTSPRAQWLWLLVPLAAVAVVAALLFTMQEPEGPAPRQGGRGGQVPDTRRREPPAPPSPQGLEVPSPGNQ
ncbi:MAG: protein kinase [Myxococcaceae bacterium]|nr:protein kinase [Myxococcaceae bacterium]